MKSRWRVGVWALAVALATAVVLLRDAPAHWLVVGDDNAAADAALVFAGDPDYERIATAATLVRDGRARLLIVTGAGSGPGDSATSLRDEALRRGVPADRIRMETVSTSTRGALVAAGSLLQRDRVRTLVLVTSPYHQRRVLLAARRALPDVTFLSRQASPSFWSPRGWWAHPASIRIVVTEYTKLGYYACRGWI